MEQNPKWDKTVQFVVNGFHYFCWEEGKKLIIEPMTLLFVCNTVKSILIMNYIFAHFEQIILTFVLCLKLKSVSVNSHWVLQRSKNQRLQTTEFTMLISTNL